MCLFHHQIIVSQQNRLHIYIYTYHCNYTLCYMYNYVYYIKYGGVLFFWATPKSTRGRIFQIKNHPAIGDPLQLKKHPKSPWRLALPSPPPGHSSARKDKSGGLHRGAVGKCGVHHQKSWENCEFTVKDMGKYGNKWGLNPYNWDDLAIGNHKKDLDKSTMRNHQDLSWFNQEKWSVVDLW